MKKTLAMLLTLVLTLCVFSAASAEGVFRVGVKCDVYGFGYQDEMTGEYSGMEIDLANMIAEALGYDEVEFTTVTAATRGELLDAGEIDCVLATFTITDARKETWDFSPAYYTDAVTALVEDSSGITCLADLVGKTVGVSSGSTSARSMVAAMIEQGIITDDTFDPDTFDAATYDGPVSFLLFDDYPAISTALSAGTIDAFCVDRSILANYMTDGRSFIADSFAPQQYGVATAKGSKLSGEIETLITGWLEDGTIDGLIEKWGL